MDGIIPSEEKIVIMDYGEICLALRMKYYGFDYHYHF